MHDRKRWHQGWLGILTALCLPTPGVFAQPVTADPQLNTLLEPIRKKYDLPALAAAVVNSKGLVRVGAVGVRKRGDATPVTVSDQFHLGSCTKAMTATLIARLVEEGKLDYRDTLGKTFPDLAKSMAPEMRRITLTELLSHHSGLPQPSEKGGDSVVRKGSLREQRQALLRELAGEKLAAAPGTEFVYQNRNYILAGHMAERVLDASWEDLITQKLFRPLKMTSAGFGPMASKDSVDQPWGHTANGKPVNNDNAPVLGPAGRVHCSLADWAKFVADQIRGARGQKALLQPETYQKLHRSPFEDKPYTWGGWLGGDKNPPTGHYVITHDGSNLRNYSTAWVAPDRDLAVLVVANQGGDDARKACHEVSALLRKKP